MALLKIVAVGQNSMAMILHCTYVFDQKNSPENLLYFQNEIRLKIVFICFSDRVKHLLLYGC